MMDERTQARGGSRRRAAAVLLALVLGGIGLTGCLSTPGDLAGTVRDTAEYGDLTRGPRIINPDVKAEMKVILGEIQSGKFAEEWIAESEAGRPNFNELEKKGHDHPIEKVGAELRDMMPWISKGKTKVQEASGGQG